MSAERDRQWRNWISVAAPPLVWITQAVLGWLVAAQSCGATPDSRHLLARTTVAFMNLVTAGTTAWALLIGRAPTRAGEESDRVQDRQTIVTFTAVFIAALVGLVVLLAGFPFLMEHACGTHRVGAIGRSPADRPAVLRSSRSR